MKFGVVIFPGSNCDRDCVHVAQTVSGNKVESLWHKETSLPRLDCLIIPGGFSYGDYLRPGAIAHFSPIMPEVKAFAERGGLVLGICNGFQILVETGLLPGALMRNVSLKFICDRVTLEIENNKLPFTCRYPAHSLVSMPIAHMEGNYFADSETLKRIEDNNQIVFRYHGDNPNGSLHSIAGVCNEKGNVLGMMPHPERVAETLLGGQDGRLLFESII